MQLDGSLGFSVKTQNPKRKSCYEGERLDRLLQSIQRKIEAARSGDADSLPENIWFKQQFAIGVNEVTRMLERTCKGKPSKVELQVVLVAADANPRWLTKHLPTLSLSANLPLISLKDNGQASLRLGQLLHLKTAIAIGVKVQLFLLLLLSFDFSMTLFLPKCRLKEMQSINSSKKFLGMNSTDLFVF
ncbi:hypothetical protein UlMin_045277 [Ulmus minor]